MTTIEIDAPAGPIDALLGLPPGQGPWPGVVVVHDAVGYVPDNKLISERIARAGYVVLTPNMYARGGRARCITRGHARQTHVGAPHTSGNEEGAARIFRQLTPAAVAHYFMMTIMFISPSG